MRRPLRTVTFTTAVVSSAAALGMSLLEVQSAVACSPPSCDPVVVAPADGATVPANLPGFPVLDARENRGPADAGVATTAVELVDAAGQIIALDRRDLPDVALLVPKVPLVPGAHELRFRSTCSLAVFGPRPNPDVVRRIVVGPARPLPTSTGRVTTSTTRVASYTVPASGSCSASREVAMTRVAFEPSDELAPFLALARTTVKVDGQFWGASTWGGGHRHPASPYIMPSQEPFEIVMGCEGARHTWGLDEGDHQGELIVELAGAPALPPVPFSFRLDCKAKAAAPAPGADGGISSDAGDESGAGAACSIGGRTTGPLAPLMVLLGAAVAFLRRRR